MADCQVLWNKVLDVIKTSTSEAVFQSFFSVVRPMSVSDDTFVLHVESPLVADWLKQKYIQVIEETLTHNAGRPLSLHIHCEPTEEEYTPPPLPAYTPATPAQKIAPPKKQIRSNLNPNFLFENFIVGSSNEMAHATAFATSQNPGHVYNPLFIYGGVGLGKTHLMQAIGHGILQRDPQANVLYISCERFINHFIESLQTKTTTQFHEFYRSNVDVLLIDDIQFLSKKEGLQEEFYHTFNTLHNEGKQIVLSSDKSPQELKNVEQRLVNRFEWGMVVDIQSPDFETRVAIIHKKLEQFNQVFDDEVCLYLANKVRNDVRKIEGALIKLIGLASVQKTPVTLELARKCLKDYITSQTVSLEAIQKAVSDFFDIRLSDIRSHRRPRAIAHPRQLAMYLCREMTNNSLNAIADSFGGKDHTTVLYACRKIAKMKTEDELVSQQITTLKKRVMENLKRL